MTETRFVKPDAELVEQAVVQGLRAAGAAIEPATWQRIEHGASNLIVIAGEVVVRVSRSPEASTEPERVQRLIDGLPELPFAVPHSLAAPIRMNGVIATVQRRVEGEPHPSGHGDPRELRALLEAIRSVPLDAVRPHLAAPRSFMGGERWYEVMTEQAIPLLSLQVREAARHAAEALARLGSVDQRLTHGDLAGSNVLWRDGHVSGVLDWDLASAGDPADDVAALGVWHGWDAIARAVDRGSVERARTIAATYPLQLVCFALVNGRPDAERDRAIARANLLLAAQS